MHPTADGIGRLLWVVAIIAAGYAALDFAALMEAADSAPQQAAGAAMSLAIAIIPYVIARAFDNVFRAPVPSREQKTLASEQP